MKNSNLKYFILLINLIYLPYIYAISSGANEPIADNELGLTAKDCALQYCESKDGMALWLTFVNECVSNPNPYGNSFSHQSSEALETNMIEVKSLEELNDPLSSFLMQKVPSLVGGYVCASISLVGLLMGYVIGVKSEEENQYIKITQRKKKYQIDN